jgi:hypothetical protein
MEEGEFNTKYYEKFNYKNILGNIFSNNQILKEKEDIFEKVED